MAEIIYGADISLLIKNELKEKTSELKNKGIVPHLETICVGEDVGNKSYERGIIKVCDEIGIDYGRTVLDEGISQELLEKKVEELNNNPAINGIMLFRPLPKHLDITAIERIIAKEKDVDCIGDGNWAALATGKNDGFLPCTAEAVIKVLDYKKIDCRGKNAVVIGRSLVIGRPLVMLLIERGATVTCCNSKTIDIAQKCKDADIIVTAAGKAELLREMHVREAKESCIVIDVGINARPDGEKGICGDVKFDEVEPLVGMITPVPGGVGSVTSTILAEHTVGACENQNVRK